jgi:hypothetical protein
MTRPQSYSHVLASFVAEATRDAQAAARLTRSGREETLPTPRTLRRVSLSRAPVTPAETLKPAA